MSHIIADPMRLNIYTDPWIQCARTDGGTAIYGIRDCLLHAAEVGNVSIPHSHSIPGHRNSAIYMDDITPFILMEMLLTRVFAPASEEDKLDIWEKGSFDASAIDRYIKECEHKGFSFDVFDGGHPFLQISTKQLQEISVPQKPLGMIQPTIPTGHSLAFYNCEAGANGEPPETVPSLTPAEYTAALIRNLMFRTAGGSGYIPSGSVSGEPPLFILTRGKNLFETLLLSMHVEPSAEIREKDRPMWEWDQYGEPVSKMISEHRFGHLASTLNPVVYIHYGEIRDGLVRNVYLKPIKFNDNDKPQNYNENFWQAATNYATKLQPDKSGKTETLSAIHMQICNEPWYSLASMCVDTPYGEKFFTSLEAVRFIRALRDEGLIRNNQRFICEIYGLSMVTNTYKSGAAQCKTSVIMPETLLTNQDGRKRLTDLVEMIQKTSQRLRLSLESCDREAKGKPKSDKNYTCSKLCSDIPRLFLADETDKALKQDGYLDQLADATGAEIPDSIKREIWDDMMHVYDSVSVPVKYIAVKEKNRPVISKPAGRGETDGFKQ